MVGSESTIRCTVAGLEGRLQMIRIEKALTIKEMTPEADPSTFRTMLYDRYAENKPRLGIRHSKWRAGPIWGYFSSHRRIRRRGIAGT